LILINELLDFELNSC